MAQFIINPDFKYALEQSTEDFSKEYAQLCRDVIEIERVWKDWTTSNPLRDIVDTNALNESMTVDQIGKMMWRIRWATDYVVFVYFGYTLADGRRIPARMWCQVAQDENNLLNLFKQKLMNNLTK